VRELLRGRDIRDSQRAEGDGPRSRSSRWEVVDELFHEGAVYQLRRRPAEPADSTPRFTRREEQVLIGALRGESNKSIAFSLGLARSTVGVLLFRAAAKLGVKSRRDVIMAYAKTRESKLPESTG
jgi:DNA-binding NarL/FixJ family response regulator